MPINTTISHRKAINIVRVLSGLGLIGLILRVIQAYFDSKADTAVSNLNVLILACNFCGAVAFVVAIGAVIYRITKGSCPLFFLGLYTLLISGFFSNAALYIARHTETVGSISSIHVVSSYLGDMFSSAATLAGFILVYGILHSIWILYEHYKHKRVNA